MVAVGAPPESHTISLSREVLPAAAVALGLPADSSIEAVHAAIYRLSSTGEVFSRSVELSIEMVLACCAPSALPRNVHLLYTLIRERDTVEGLVADPVFQAQAQPVADMVRYFAGLVAKAEADRALALALSGSGGAGEADGLRAARARLEDGGASGAGTGLPGGSDTSTYTPASASSSSSSSTATAGSSGTQVPWEESDVLAVLGGGTKTGSWPGAGKAAEAAKEAIGE